jgi:hypothetical protein
MSAERLAVTRREGRHAIGLGVALVLEKDR